MFYLLLICYITIFISIILLLVCALERNKKSFTLRKHKNDEYAILIPARDESNVIQKLLESIKIQNNDMSNVYVIVEQKEDKTCDIVKKYGANIYIRKKPIKSRKGYAIDECIKEILKSKHYDLYFIFDADNVIDKNFIKIMLDYWHKGYDIATGYRNILNPFNWISGCSILMFSLINTIVNKNNIKNNKPVLLCGTGLYISGKIIDKLGGFPFNTLTEDYELSLYINANNISSTYIENAIYYDEQPVKMSSSIKQRTRWIQGFYEARKKRLKDVKNLSNKIGITPLILIVFSVICIIILSIIDISGLTVSKTKRYLFRNI